jgi:ferritin-like metal-binding protein YciE
MTSLVDPQFSSTAEAQQSGNVTGTERWLSLAAGVLLTLAAARRGSLLRSLVLGSAGASLIGRGATGYCAMKASLHDGTPLRAGLREQWTRARRGFEQFSESGAIGNRLSTLRARALGGTSRSIDNMHVLYVIELQELYSAEQQMADLIERIGQSTAHTSLAARFARYANDLRLRALEIEKVLTSVGAPTHAHPDDAMRALLNEAHKVSRIAAVNVRDAALLASLQRIIHYKIAGYGTIAAYAKALGRGEEAARFAQYSDEDKRMDAELSEFAQSTLNPEATHAPTQSGAEMRTH